MPARELPSRRASQTEVVILGNGRSLLAHPWDRVPREKVYRIGVNQSWRVVPDVDAHFSSDVDQFDFDNPTAAGYGGRAFYDALEAVFHTGHYRAANGVLLHRHDALGFSRHPFRKRHHGAHTQPPHLREDGGVVLKPGPGQAGSSAYIALQMAAASGFERIWLAGLDMDDKKFDGAQGWTAFGKAVPTNQGAWSNSVRHDALWAKVPADVKAITRVILPSRCSELEKVAWPW